MINARNSEDRVLDLKIYGEIGEGGFFDEKADTENGNVKTLEDLDKILRENKNAKLIRVFINSTGGSVFDGIAIYNMLKRNRAYKQVFIEGFACSIASVIAMAGNKIVMPKSSLMMIHNAWTVSMGNAKELRKVADDLDKINDSIVNAYLKQTHLDENTVRELMDNETYLDADKCLEYGFCTAIDDSLDVEEDVNNALDEYTGLYQNKLNTLNAIKNAIKDIQQVENDVETEEQPLEADAGEVEQTNEPVEEAQPANEEVVDEVKTTEQQVENIKENALKRFFNLQEEN